MIDKEAEDLDSRSWRSSWIQRINGFPATLCISINEAVVHGIPSENVFQDGDIVSVSTVEPL